MSHRHYCHFAGHNWQCAEDCECICGVAMEENDHSKCPVELRASPDHSAEQQRRMAEAMSSEPDAAFMQESNEGESALPHCECGCVETESSKVVGWCFHCDHVYANYGPDIQDRHFADNCPDAPKEPKKSARKRLSKH
jgi:hypothetical protein